MNKFTNILILAAGDGTRFWPLTKKTYYPFLDKPLIAYLINKVAPFTNNITIVVNKDDLHLLQGLKSDNIQIITQDSNIPGMGGAIETCKGRIQGDTLILNAEDIFDYSILTQYFPLIKEKNPQIIFLAKKIDKYFPGGYLKFNNDQIIEIVEKPGEDQMPSNRTKLVADYFSDFNLITNALSQVKTNSDDYYEQAISMLLKQNITSSYIKYEDYWHVLKYPWHVLQIMNFFLNTLEENVIHKNAHVSDKAIVVPPVYFDEGVKIGDFAKIVGPTFIGKNAIVGDYALVRNSHIGKNCLIGGYSEVTRSYLNDKVMLHRNYIGDSVIGENVLFGSGATTANFRFDEKNPMSTISNIKIDTGLAKLGAIIGQNAKIGVNATIYPGVKIGNWTYIAPGEILEQDIDDQIFIKDGKIHKNLLVKSIND